MNRAPDDYCFVDIEMLFGHDDKKPSEIIKSLRLPLLQRQLYVCQLTFSFFYQFLKQLVLYAGEFLIKEGQRSVSGLQL